MPQRPRRRHFVPLLAPALLALWVACFTATAQPTTAPTQQWDLFAHGSATRLWYAVTTPVALGGPDRHTFIRTREAQGKWESLVDFPSRLTAMSDADGRLIVALADGEWKRITPEQFLGGPPLPGDGEMFSLSGGADGEIWCVGMGAAAPSASATTRASSSQPSISTRPVATVAPGLFRLTASGWRHVAPLPGGTLDHAPRQLSLAWIDKAPTLAYPSAADAVRVAQWRETDWVPLGELKPGFAVRKLTLFDIEGKLAVWAVGGQGPGTLFVRDATDGQWQSRPLKVGGEVKPVDVALAAFHGELRLLAITGDERFYEQRFDLNATPVGPWRELDQPPPPQGTTLGDLLSWAGLAILMVITLATANQGGIVQVAVVNKVRLPLAPLSLRLAAGLIDLWPFYIAPYLTFGRLHEGVRLSQLPDDTFAYWVLGATLLVYFLHTAIAEAVWGRSFGKMFVGLRVLSLNGEKPSLAAILLRNLIRVIEVPIGVPLLMIFLNPLRQRFGDFFASTVVTRKLPRELQEKLD